MPAWAMSRATRLREQRLLLTALALGLANVAAARTPSPDEVAIRVHVGQNPETIGDAPAMYRT